MARMIRWGRLTPPDRAIAVGYGTPVSVGTALAEGVKDALARADHVHDLGDGIVVYAKIGDGQVYGTKIAVPSVGSVTDNTEYSTTSTTWVSTSSLIINDTLNNYDFNIHYQTNTRIKTSDSAFYAYIRAKYTAGYNDDESAHNHYSEIGSSNKVFYTVVEADIPLCHPVGQEKGLPVGAELKTQGATAYQRYFDIDYMEYCRVVKSA